MHIRTHLKNPKIIIAGCTTLGSATPSSEGMMSMGWDWKTCKHSQNVQLQNVQLPNVYLPNVHLPNVQLQNVQVTNRSGYQTSITSRLPNVQFTKRSSMLGYVGSGQVRVRKNPNFKKEKQPKLAFT